MEFLVLGPLELVVDAAPVRLTARRQRALLAALLLRAGTVVPVDALIEALWGDDPPDSAASVLRLYVSNVRRCLPPGRLVTRSPGYLLRLEEGGAGCGALRGVVRRWQARPRPGQSEAGAIVARPGA